VTSYGAALEVSINLPARHAAKHHAHPRKNPMFQESASRLVLCAASGPGDTRKNRPRQSRTPAQSAIPERLHTGWKRSRAVFAAVERKAKLDLQWPLNPTGKNSE